MIIEGRWSDGMAKRTFREMVTSRTVIASAPVEERPNSTRPSGENLTLGARRRRRLPAVLGRSFDACRGCRSDPEAAIANRSDLGMRARCDFDNVPGCSFRQSGFSQALFQSVEILRSPQGIKDLKIGDAQRGIDATHARHCHFRFRLSPGQRSSSRCYGRRQDKYEVPLVTHRLFCP